MNLELQQRVWLGRWVTLRAGQLTWNYFQKGVSSEQKADDSPVTVADREAEELFRNAIRKEFPGDGFLGEEYGEETSRSGFKWIIDPIDGTRNFVRRIPLWGNMLGLEHNGEMVAGFVCVPGFGHLYHAVQGGGAFRNDEPIHCSGISALEDAQIIYSGLDWFDKTGTTDAFRRLSNRVGRARGYGDVYGFMLVAQGSAEAMIEPDLKPWDIAATKVIIEEAGGVFTDYHGVNTIYGKGALAASKTLHGKILATLHQR